MSDASIPIGPFVSGHFYPTRQPTEPSIRVEVIISSTTSDALKQIGAHQRVEQLLEYARRLLLGHSGHCEDCGCELFCDCPLPCVTCALAMERNPEPEG